MQELKVALLFLSFIIWTFVWFNKSKISSTLLGLLFLTVLSYSIFEDPFNENDFNRYFIDTLHLNNDIPIYSKAPISSPLRENYESVFDGASYLNYKSIYPIVTLRFFQLILLLSNSNFDFFLFYLKMFAILIPLSVFIYFFKSHNTSKLKASALIACNPLFILEWYINMHYDFLLAILFIALMYSKSLWSRSIVLILGINLKYIIVAAILFLKISISKKIKLIFTTTIGLIGLLFISLSTQEILALFQNLLVFGREWEMNSGVFRLERTIFSNLLPQLNSITASYVFNFFILIITFYWLRKKQFFLDPTHQLWFFFQVLILTSPIVNPWYFTWTFPLIVLHKKTSIFFFLSISPVFLSYTFYFSSSYLKWFNIEHALMIFFLIIGLLDMYKKSLNTSHSKLNNHSL